MNDLLPPFTWAPEEGVFWRNAPGLVRRVWGKDEIPVATLEDVVAERLRRHLNYLRFARPRRVSPAHLENLRQHAATVREHLLLGQVPNGPAAIRVQSLLGVLWEVDLFLLRRIMPDPEEVGDELPSKTTARLAQRQLDRVLDLRYRVIPASLSFYVELLPGMGELFAVGGNGPSDDKVQLVFAKVLQDQGPDPWFPQALAAPVLGASLIAVLKELEQLEKTARAALAPWATFLLNKTLREQDARKTEDADALWAKTQSEMEAVMNAPRPGETDEERRAGEQVLRDLQERFRAWEAEQRRRT